WAERHTAEWIERRSEGRPAIEDNEAREGDGRPEPAILRPEPSAEDREGGQVEQLEPPECDPLEDRVLWQPELREVLDEHRKRRGQGRHDRPAENQRPRP